MQRFFDSIFAILLDTEKGILRKSQRHFRRWTPCCSRRESLCRIRINHLRKLKQRLDQCIPLAPLHNPYNLGGIRCLPSSTPRCCTCLLYSIQRFIKRCRITPTCTRFLTHFMSSTVFGGTVFTEHRTDTSPRERRKSSDAH